jgi:hypothetical protein
MWQFFTAAVVAPKQGPILGQLCSKIEYFFKVLGQLCSKIEYFFKVLGQLCS